LWHLLVRLVLLSPIQARPQRKKQPRTLKTTKTSATLNHYRLLSSHLIRVTTIWMSRISSSKPLIYQHQAQRGINVGFTSVNAGNMSLTVLDKGQTAQHAATNRRVLENELGIQT